MKSFKSLAVALILDRQGETMAAEAAPHHFSNPYLT